MNNTHSPHSPHSVAQKSGRVLVTQSPRHTYVVGAGRVTECHRPRTGRRASAKPGEWISQERRLTP